MVAVQDLEAARAVWLRLGFVVDPPGAYAGCTAAEVRFGGGALRLVAIGSDAPEPTNRNSARDSASSGADKSRSAASGSLAEAVAAKLLQGEGVLGWLWNCRDAQATADRLRGQRNTNDAAECSVEELSGTRDQWLLGPAWTPGATTILTNAPPVETVQASPNRCSGLDHIVLMVSDAAAVGAVYESGFGLRGRHAQPRKGAYCFLKVGDAVLEIVGPQPPTPGPTQAKLWGLALTSDELEATRRYFLQNAINAGTIQSAIQGGRICSLREEPNGVAIAVLG